MWPVGYFEDTGIWQDTVCEFVCLEDWATVDLRLDVILSIGRCADRQVGGQLAGALGKQAFGRFTVWVFVDLECWLAVQSFGWMCVLWLVGAQTGGGLWATGTLETLLAGGGELGVCGVGVLAGRVCGPSVFGTLFF